MIFKNTFKLLLSNFSLTYKTLIYKLIILLLALAVSVTIGVPFLMHLSKINFFNFIVEEFVSMFSNINLGNVFVCFKNLFFEIINVFKTINLNLLFNAILSVFTFVLINGVLGSFSELAVIDCLNGSLSSKTKLSFFKSLISKMFKSILMTVVKFLISLIYIACLIAILYFGFLTFDFGGIAVILSPIVMFLVFVIISGFHLTIISGFAPSIIVHDEGIFKALIKGFRTVRKKFFKVLSTALMIVFILTIVNLIVAVFSFFAGLIFTLPISYVVLNLFKVVSFYECNGMRYYVGDNIRTPLRKNEQDKIKVMKYIV